MTPAEQAAQLRSDLESLALMHREAKYEYTSKKRLQVLADGAFSSLIALYEQQLAVVEAMAEAEASPIIKPTPNDIVVAG